MAPTRADNVSAPFEGLKENESQKSDDEDIHWTSSINEGTDTIYYFAEAVSGKTLKQDSYDLLRGVTDVLIEKERIRFVRCDKEEIELSAATTHGSKFFKDWEKSKTNLESKFGPAGKQFLENIEAVHVIGDRIEVARKGPELLSVDMGERKFHHAFDLRGLRFSKMSMKVDSSGKNPSLKDIEGVSVILNAPGFHFPVDVKEFAKKRLEKNNDIKIGIKNPVPAPVRAMLFLPPVLRFHFEIARKE